MLQVEELVVRYGGLEALHQVSLTVADGDFVAVLGRNGAGKSTLVKAIAGVLPVASGRIIHDGDRIDGARPAQVVRHGIAVVPEGRQLFGQLNVRDNLRLGAFGVTSRGLLGMARTLLPRQRLVEARVERVLHLLPELAGLLDRPAGVLSGGEQQMVAVGRALVADPRVLVVDELSLGLAPRVVTRLLAHLATLNQEGISIVLIEQNIALALQASRSAYVLEGGVVRFRGRSADLANDDTVLSAYLGVSEAVH
jgi:ABC-type branched-subunit amino acid transport system ATPase component